MAKRQISKKPGLIARLLNLFSPSDEESQKARFLKGVNKELSKTKVKFYKYGSGEALPQLAKFFFDVYKTVGPAQPVFKNTPIDSATLKVPANAVEAYKEAEGWKNFKTIEALP